MTIISGVFVEPRLVEQIYHNIINFFEILPNYKLYFYCGKDTKNIHEKNLLERNINTKNLIIRELNVNNLNANTYSNLFKNIDFWSDIEGQYILTIQTDGCLCKNSTYKIQDFLKYDYVGGYAHWFPYWQETIGICTKDDFQCLNGGFSLRNKQKMINVLEHFKPQDTESYSHNLPLEKYAEDMYFAIGMIKLNYNVGLDRFAANFCSHTDFIYETFCIHNFYYYSSKEKLLKCLLYCQEYLQFINLQSIKN